MRSMNLQRAEKLKDVADHLNTLIAQVGGVFLSYKEMDNMSLSDFMRDIYPNGIIFSLKPIQETKEDKEG